MENTQILEALANQIQILMWAMGGGFAGTWSMMFLLFKGMNKRVDGIEKKLDRIDEKLVELDKRILVIETTLHMKECCLLKDQRIQEKAE